MDKVDYVMYVDDSGYSYTGTDTNGKEHEISHYYTGLSVLDLSRRRMVLLGHHKYFVGILIPKVHLSGIICKLSDISDNFYQAIGSTEHTEIHATDAYAQTDATVRQAFLDYMNGIASVIKMYNLTVIVSPKDTTIKSRQCQLSGGLAPNQSGFVSKKGSKYHKLSLIELCNMAVGAIGSGGTLMHVYCDEGLRARGSSVNICGDVRATFLSSKDNVLIQFADSVAWLYNRVNIVIPDRINRKHSYMLDDDQLLIDTLGNLQNQIIDSSNMPAGALQMFVQYTLDKRLGETPVVPVSPVVKKVYNSLFDNTIYNLNNNINKDEPTMGKK